jgi:hypothetical protein
MKNKYIVNIGYKQIYPLREKLKRQVYYRNNTYNMHKHFNSKTKIVLTEDILLEEKQLGQELGIFAIMFMQCLQRKRPLLSICEIVDVNLFCQLKEVVSNTAHKYDFPNSVNIKEVYLARYSINKACASIHFIDSVNKKQNFICIEIIMVDQRYVIRNIKYIVHNTIVEFEGIKNLDKKDKKGKKRTRAV